MNTCKFLFKKAFFTRTATNKQRGKFTKIKRLNTDTQDHGILKTKNNRIWTQEELENNLLETFLL